MLDYACVYVRVFVTVPYMLCIYVLVTRHAEPYTKIQNKACMYTGVCLICACNDVKGRPDGACLHVPVTNGWLGYVKTTCMLW